MKKKQKENLYWTLGLIFIIVFIYGGTHGWFQGITNFFPPKQATPSPGDTFTQDTRYTVTVSIIPSSICVGDRSIGSIDSNIPNGVCSIFYNPNSAGWIFYGNANLDNNGDFRTYSPVMTTSGSSIFAVICCDSSGNCKMSNQPSLNVRNCDTDGDGIPDEIDPDDDNDGYSDEEELEEGTDPKDPNDYPGNGGISDPCPVYCQGLGGYSTGRFVTSPGYCSSPEISKLFSPGYCCCMPIPSVPTYTCGQGVDAQCGGTCPSDYPNCIDVYTNDLYIYHCMCTNSNNAVHPDWKPDGDMFNDQGDYPPEEPIPNCIDSDGVNFFSVGTTTYLGVSYPDVCHAGTSSYAVDEYVCIDDVAVKKEVNCPNTDCVNGKCMTGTTTVYNACLNIGFKNGGACFASSPPPAGWVLYPAFDTLCGDLYPLNPALCAN